ncbi:MAG: hypothetical protein ACOZFS_08310 [Thermodesulfobacteriota bacterium]
MWLDKTGKKTAWDVKGPGNGTKAARCFKDCMNLEWSWATVPKKEERKWPKND